MKEKRCRNSQELEDSEETDQLISITEKDDQRTISFEQLIGGDGDYQHILAVCGILNVTGAAMCVFLFGYAASGPDFNCQ